MNLKIGLHFCPNITSKDWVLAKGRFYEVRSRCYKRFVNYIPQTAYAIMPSEQFDELVKKGLLVRDTEREESPKWKLTYGRLGGYSAWRFNVGEGGKEN